MTDDKISAVRSIVMNSHGNTMRSKKSRTKLAHLIADAINAPRWNVESFVEEMYGLNFISIDERELFIQFFCTAL